MAAEKIEDLQHEIKYVLPRHQAHLVQGLLDRVCVPDPEFPAGVVASLYFDTPDLQLLREKLDSHYFKTKIRARWYEDPESGLPIGRVFAEAKWRVGTRRRKVRVETDFSAETLMATALSNPVLQELPARLQGLGPRIPQPVVPLLVVRYRRTRFLDPQSGVRIALDTDIAPGRSNPQLAGRRHGLACETAVLEVKGSTSQLPRSLAAVGALGCRRGSFSKYAACCKTLRLT